MRFLNKRSLSQRSAVIALVISETGSLGQSSNRYGGGEGVTPWLWSWEQTVELVPHNKYPGPRSLSFNAVSPLSVKDLRPCFG